MTMLRQVKHTARQANAVTFRALVRVGRWLGRKGHGRTARRGVVLVITLWIIVVLGMIASSLAFDVQVGSKLTLLQKEQFVAYNLAKSAIGVGMTHLQNDMIIDFHENTQQPYDAFSDVWALRDLRENEKIVQVDERRHPDWTYELEIIDEESKIPLNQASFKIIKAMLEYYGFEAPDSDDMAYAIIDYRDQDDMAGGEPGAYENEYYSAEMGQRVKTDMAADLLIYRCPNEAFLNTEQLLDVYGISSFPEVFYGFDPSEKAEREIAMRDAIASGRRVRGNRERKRGRKNEPLPLKDIVSVSVPGTGNGRINLNTASLEVLTILMHAATDFASIESAKAAAESIIDFRGDNDSRAPDPEKAFKSTKDLAQVPGVDTQALSQLGSLGIQPSFSSKTFKIIGKGSTGKAHQEIEALVERNMDTYNPDDARLASNKGRGLDRGKRQSRSRGEGGARSSGEGGTGRGEGGGRPDDDYIRVPAVRLLEWRD